MSRFLIVFLLSACGCAGTLEISEPLCEPDKKMVRDPARVWPFFRECFRCEHWAHAHKALRPKTIEYEAFYIAFASYQLLRDVVLKSHVLGNVEEVDVNTKRITVCNETFGFLEQFTLHKTFGVIWTIRITEEQKKRFRKYAFGYWEYQYEADDDFFVYPRGTASPKKWSSCRRDVVEGP